MLPEASPFKAAWDCINGSLISRALLRLPLAAMIPALEQGDQDIVTTVMTQPPEISFKQEEKASEMPT